jgi:DNA repair photolyase
MESRLALQRLSSSTVVDVLDDVLVDHAVLHHVHNSSVRVGRPAHACKAQCDYCSLQRYAMRERKSKAASVRFVDNSPEM